MATLSNVGGIMAKKEKKFVPVAKPVEIKPIVPRYIRIDVAKDFVGGKLWYCLTWVNKEKTRTESVGGSADRICRDIQRKVIIENLPPYQLDVWNGFMFEREEDAIMAREAVRLFYAEKMEGGLLENI
jgi:hypothetical protein